MFDHYGIALSQIKLPEELIFSRRQAANKFTDLDEPAFQETLTSENKHRLKLCLNHGVGYSVAPVAFTWPGSAHKVRLSVWVFISMHSNDENNPENELSSLKFDQAMGSITSKSRSAAYQLIGSLNMIQGSGLQPLPHPPNGIRPFNLLF